MDRLMRRVIAENERLLALVGDEKSRALWRAFQWAAGLDRLPRRRRRTRSRRRSSSTERTS